MSGMGGPTQQSGRNITTFRAPIKGIEVPSTGIEMEQRAAGRVGELGAEAGHDLIAAGEMWKQGGEALAKGLNTFGERVQTYQNQQDIIHGGSTVVQAEDQLQQRYNQLVQQSDPADPTLTERFKQNVLGPMLDRLGDNFNTEAGQRWWGEHRNEIETRWDTMLNADNVRRAGIATEASVNTVVNSYTNMAAANPSQFEALRDQMDSYLVVAAQHSHLAPDAYTKLTTEGVDTANKQLAFATLKGMLQNPNNGPANVVAALDSGRFNKYITGVEADELRGHATTQARIFAEQTNADNRRQGEQINATYENTLSEIEGRITIGPNGQATIPNGYFQSILDAQEKATQAASKIPGAKISPELGRSMFDFGLKMNELATKGTPAVTDPNTFMTMTRRMFLQPGDPQQLTMAQVYRAAADGKLSIKDFEFLKGAVSEGAKNPQMVDDQKQFQSFMQGYKKFITNSTMMKSDALGDQRLYEFERDKQQQFQVGLQRGLTASDMLDPNSKNFIGSDISRYQPTLGQVQRAQAQGVATGVAPLPPVGKTVWKPGMSMDELAKTLGH